MLWSKTPSRKSLESNSILHLDDFPEENLPPCPHNCSRIIWFEANDILLELYVPHELIVNLHHLNTNRYRYNEIRTDKDKTGWCKPMSEIAFQEESFQTIRGSSA